MAAFLAIVVLLIIFWFMYGRGAWIIYNHKKDDGVSLPENMDKDQVMDALKKDLSYKDTKEIYFDEHGEICITGKYDTYCVRLIDGKACVDDLIINEYSTENVKSKAASFLIKSAYVGSLFDRKNARKIEEMECIRAYITKVFDHNAPINAHKKYTAMKNARKYSAKISALLIAGFVALMIIVVMNNTGNANVVKDGYFSSYSTKITVGQAFDDFFSDPKWENYSEGASEYVRFTGGCTWEEEPADMIVIFKVEEDVFYVYEVIVHADNMRFNIDEEYVLEAIYESYGK